MSHNEKPNVSCSYQLIKSLSQGHRGRERRGRCLIYIPQTHFFLPLLHENQKKKKTVLGTDTFLFFLPPPRLKNSVQGKELQKMVPGDYYEYDAI